MKRQFHLILIFLTLAASHAVTAQDLKPTPTPEPIALRMVPLGITMILGTLKEVEATEDVRMSMVMMAGFFPEKFAEESEMMTKLAGAERKEQLVMLEALTDSLRGKLPPAERWTVDFGRRWGKTYGKAILLSQSDFKDDSRIFLESLLELGDFLKSCEKDIPPEVISRLRKIAAAYPKEEKFSIGVVTGSFVSASIELIDYLDSLERESPMRH